MKLIKDLILQKRINVFVLLSLILCSLWSMEMVWLRVIYLKETTYLFLIWNLSLAWVPYLISLLVQYSASFNKKKFGYYFILSIIWLLFYPNAPYIVTDFIHLEQSASMILWYDLVLVLSFSLTGLFLGFESMKIFHKLVIKKYSQNIGWAFIFVATGLTSFGLYLGRFARWNSWDIFTRPLQVLTDVWERYIHPFDHPRTIIFSLLFFGFMLVFYMVFYTLTETKRE